MRFSIRFLKRRRRPGTKNPKAKKSIEYSTKSWNPISGCVPVDCAVAKRKACWAQIMAKRLGGNPGTGYSKIDSFQPTFHLNKLNDPLHWRRRQKVACCFMGDIACAKPEWMETILKIIQRTPQHRYYLLTKQPSKLVGIKFPKNVWLGVTINCQKDLYRVDELYQIEAGLHFGSCEPLYEDIDFGDAIFLLDWLIIGAQTHPDFQPDYFWVLAIIEWAEENTVPVFMKDNLTFEPKRYDFPRGVTP